MDGNAVRSPCRIEQRGLIVVGAVHPRRDWPDHHQVRSERRKQIVRVGFHAEPALVSRFGEDEGHTVMDLRDQVIRRHSYDGKGANPLVALRMTPVLPKSREGKGRAVLHGNGIGLLCTRSFERTPLKEAFNGNDAAALGVGARKAGRLATLSALH